MKNLDETKAVVVNLIDGKLVASFEKENIKREVATLRDKGMAPPMLVAVIVGEDGASLTYVGHKEKMCNEVGFASRIIRLKKETTTEELILEIEKLNRDNTVDGFIVQLPLPGHINESVVINAINPEKDVDGFTAINTGKMIIGEPCFLPATPNGILMLLDYYKIDTTSKNCVVIGRSNIVGRPIANLLSMKGRDATVTICHSRTKNLKEITKEADILVVALGQREFVTADMVKDGVVVIDVGITRVDAPDTKNGWRLLGDVNYKEVAPKSSYITPVPGGVGPMTIISLMKNTLIAYKNKYDKV